MTQANLRVLTRLPILPFLAVLLLLTSIEGHAQVRENELAVLDTLGGSKLLGAIYLVDTETRKRRVLSDFSNSAQGDQLITGNDIAVAPSGLICFTTGKTIGCVNPLTGNRKILSDLENVDQGTGGEGFDGMVIDDAGLIYAVDPGADLLFLVDPDNGNRSVLSRLSDPDEGETLQRAERLVLESSGDTLLLLDRGRHKIVRVVIATGQRTLVSRFTDSAQGERGSNLLDLAVEPSGNILVTESFGLRLFRVDPNTGDRSVLSRLDDLGQGVVLRSPDGVVVTESGHIFVIDSQGGQNILRQGSVVAVDSVSGNRLEVNDFGDDTQGATGFRPTAAALTVAVTPTAEDLRLVRTVLLATESIQVQKEAIVVSGNVIANDPTGRTLINKGARTPEGFEVAGETLLIKKEATVGGDVLVGNEFKNQGTIGGAETIGDFPVFTALPPFNDPITGDANIVVRKNGFLSLPEGRFKSISIQKNATLVLEGGVYETETFKAAKTAEVIYDAPVEIRMSKGANFGKGSVFVPADDSFLDAKDALLYSGGDVKTGKSSEIHANIIAPGSAIRLGKFAELIGFAYGGQIVLGKSATVLHRSFLEDSLIGLE